MRAWILHLSSLVSPLVVGSVSLPFQPVGEQPTLLVAALVTLVLSGTACAAFQLARYVLTAWIPGPDPRRTAMLTLCSAFFVGMASWGESTAWSEPCGRGWTLPDECVQACLLAGALAYVAGPWTLPRAFYVR
jgi:hypothetical protein